MVATINREFQVNTFTEGDQYDPAVAIAPDGSFVVVWTSVRQDGGAVWGVYGQQFNADGTPKGSEFQVNVTIDGNQSNADVAIDSQGNVVVVWEGNGVGDNKGIFARRFDRDGNVIGAGSELPTSDVAGEVIEEVTGGALGDVFSNIIPGLPRNPISNPVPDTSDSTTSIQGEFRVNASTEYTQNAPTIAMNSSGDFVIAWEDGGPYTGAPNQDLFARTFAANGESLGSDYRIHAENLETQIDPAIAINDQGNILFAWASMGQEANTGTDSYGIFARPYTMAGPAGPEFQVNKTTVNAQVNPHVFVGPQGDSSFVWESVGGPGFFSGYLSGQESPPSEFMVEVIGGSHRAAIDGDGNTVVTTVTGSKVEVHQIQIPQQTVLQNTTIFERTAKVGGADIALNESGNGVIVWAIEDQDGSGDGIFAQRFETTSQAPLKLTNSINPATVPSLDITFPVLFGLCSIGSMLRWLRWSKR